MLIAKRGGRMRSVAGWVNWSVPNHLVQERIP